MPKMGHSVNGECSSDAGVDVWEEFGLGFKRFCRQGRRTGREGRREADGSFSVSRKQDSEFFFFFCCPHRLIRLCHSKIQMCKRGVHFEEGFGKKDDDHFDVLLATKYSLTSPRGKLYLYAKHFIFD